MTWSRAKHLSALIALLLLSSAPLLWRLLDGNQNGSAGLLSDASFGLLLLLAALYTPHWLRILLVLIWALFQGGAQELFAAMQRLPGWRDLHYLADPDFVANTTAGFNLSAPLLVWSLLIAAAWVCLAPLPRPRRVFYLPAGLGLAAAALLLQNQLSNAQDDRSVASRYNPVHWFLVDAFGTPRMAAAPAELPPGLARLDLEGRPLLPQGRARNVLIVTLEGMPGLYHPEIAAAMGTAPRDASMPLLAAATPDAMLIPDFVDHSHQTIRGLYALFCGDFSKLSWDTPKAVELQANPARAGDCLPAQLARRGWDTHFLQAASLVFMAKDRLMPLMGFEQVHGSEWFTKPNPYPFEWGVIDPVFFDGARDYIAELRKRDQPWMLTLLTVGTHQPYAVPDDIAARFPNRKLATVSLLDQAVADFIDNLRRDGVLEDTLVIITSDESHGSELAEWVSSWGLGIVLAPERSQLPRLKRGGYGLVDMAASVLDYLGQPMPASIIGRSFFRDYDSPREMVSYTASKRRWHTADGLRYECSDDGRCRVGRAESLLGPPPAEFMQDPDGSGGRIFAISAALDAKLASSERVRVLEFANGETRQLPETVINEWSENLVGAQYLDFPANSRVEVSVRVKVLQASAAGVRMQLKLKQWEYDLENIQHDGFPLLHANEEGRLEFSFDNPERRQAFSFHLLGEGKDATVKLEEFRVRVDAGSG